MEESEIRDLKDALVRLTMTIELMSDKQDQMIEDVKKIKEAMYNPEQGIYARIRDLEQWQNGVSRVLWTGGLAVAGLLMNSLYAALFS
jgi:L-ribulose-5-phosphate 3-epimerase UlaE